MGVWSDQRARAQLVIVAENWWHRVPAFRPFSSRPISHNHPSNWRPFLDGEEEEPSNFQKASTCSRLSGMFSVLLRKCCSFTILSLPVSTGWLNHHWVTPVYQYTITTHIRLMGNTDLLHSAKKWLWVTAIWIVAATYGGRLKNCFLHLEFLYASAKRVNLAMKKFKWGDVGK